jgi:carbamoyltransferase
MYILGISAFFHDSSACLMKDGEVVFAAEEERFTRKKHDTSFPINAINAAFKHAGITIDQVDYVGFYEKPLMKFERVLNQFIETYPRAFSTFYKVLPGWLNQKLKVQSTIRKKLKYKGDILFVEHHLAHAASSYLISPFEEAAIMTMDGVGEEATTVLGHAKGNDIKLLEQINFPHSIGLLYSAATAHLGFSVNNSEYKVMGLSPYGNPDAYYDSFKKIVDIKDDGSFRLDMEYFDYHYKMTMPSKKYIEEFGPIRKREGELTQKHKDIAASLQKVTEEAIFKSLNHLQELTKSENLCFAGGCALNSVANGKILSKTKFKRMYIIPAAGDGGTAVGVAVYIYNTLLKNKRTYVMDHAYLGPGYSTEEIKEYLDKNNIVYSTFKDDAELVKTTADMISKNSVIGWFQGRMEFGPRALGDRSILASPCTSEMKDVLNLKVKHREFFRPFAPVVSVEDANDYFECDNPIPIPTDFMLMVYPIRKDKQEKIPAVTHVDGSGRLQTIRKEKNPLYHDVIKQFGKITGVPILVNTSFNIRGEPIVCSPKNAYECMMGTGIDALVMDKFMIKRADNPKDMWDSEKLAKD